MTALFRIIVCLLISQASSTLAVAADSPPERATFVGTFIDIKELTCPDDRRVEPGIKYEFRPWVDEHGDQIVVTCEPTEFELTYRVDRVLAGHLSARQIIKFRTHAWTRVPALANVSTSLIELGHGDKPDQWGLIHSNDVFPTAEGSYAQCGCEIPQDPSEADTLWAPQSACKQVEFKPKVRLSLTDASVVRMDRLKNDRSFIVRNEYAECVAGVDIADIRRLWKEADLKGDND